jgi:hypothetical protein
MDVEATVNIRGEDLVVSGKVTLPRVLDHNAYSMTDVEITGVRLDTLDEPPITRDHNEWNATETSSAEYALYEDAVNTVNSRYR